MCNRYGTPRPDDLTTYFGMALPLASYRPAIGPRQDGPFILAGQALVGQWALIPDRIPGRVPIGWNGKPISTNNCRSEGMRSKSPTFKPAWLRGQRCLIPALNFDEPYWGSPTGQHIWWRFSRADGAPWALAGLWND